MIVSLSTSKLKEVLELASRFVAKHSTLPILENIYIKANIDGLIFRATDMEKYIEIELPINVDSEGAITVNAKMLLDIIRTIEDDEVKLIINEDNDTINIKTSVDEFKLKGISANEYVALPNFTSDINYKINSSDFLKGIEKVSYAVTEKAFSPVLTGILLRIKKENKKLIFVGTDSFRLAEYKVDYNYDIANDLDVIIPKINILDISKVIDFVISKEGEEFDMSVSENLISLNMVAGDMKILVSSLIIKGDFPNYEREAVIPTQFNTKLLLNKIDLEKAIRKVVILTQAENYFVEFDINDGLVYVKSGLTDLGESKTQIVSSVEGENVSFGINGKYILDFLKAIDGDKVSINIVSEEKPIVFKDVDDINYTYVVRPLVK